MCKCYQARLNQFPPHPLKASDIASFSQSGLPGTLSKQFPFQCYNPLITQKIGSDHAAFEKWSLVGAAHRPGPRCDFLCPLLQQIVIIRIVRGGNGVLLRVQTADCITGEDMRWFGRPNKSADPSPSHHCYQAEMSNSFFSLVSFLRHTNSNQSPLSADVDIALFFLFFIPSAGRDNLLETGARTSAY